MKRVGGLFEEIVSRRNLVEAVWRAAGGKRDRREVISFMDDFQSEMATIRSELASGTFTFSNYHSFRVRDTKTRLIHAPPFRDRVVHHAIIGPTGPIFERGAIHHSYACRRGKGQHAALAQARLWTRRASWYGKIDVRKFYDCVDHEILRRMLRRRFRERRLLRVFDSLLESYQTRPGKGLPIGALTSQYLGNFYLDAFDRQMKATRLAGRYVRYMDDIVIWADQRTLATLRRASREFLDSLGLELKHGGEWNRCARGIPFLGFVIYPDRIRLNRLGRRRLRRKLRELHRGWRRGEIGERELQDRATSLLAHAATGDDLAWRQAILNYYNWHDCERETLEPASRDTRRVVDQHGQELPRGDPQQEEARQPQQEPGLSCLSGSRHEDQEQALRSPDVASSGSRPHGGRDEASGKPSTGVDIHRGRKPERAAENTPAEAPRRPRGAEP